VAIRCYGSIAASLPAQACIFKEVLAAGGHPYPVILPGLADEFDYHFYTGAKDPQLARPSPFYEMIARDFECDIYLLSETNTRRLSNVDPSRQAISRQAHSELFDLWLKRGSSGALRWVICAVPTLAYAQDADMSLEEFEDFIYSTTYANADDPVAEWKAIGESQSRLVDWLRGKKTVHVVGDNVDLTFSIDGRSFSSCDGRLNMPDGEIFTGPVEDSVDGWLHSSFPAISGGKEVRNPSLRFAGGVVVHAEADSHQDYLLRMLDTDPGARRLGEFGIGTNNMITRFTKNILFDEKIGGTIHVALGHGYPDTGSENESAIHWDFLCDMKGGGQILVDGQPFYDSGRFLV
jgi:aminopeptidase